MQISLCKVFITLASVRVCLYLIVFFLMFVNHLSVLVIIISFKPTPALTFLSFLHCPRSNNLFRGQKVKCKLDRLKFLHIAPCLDDEEHLVIFAVMRKLFLKCWIHSSRLFFSLSLFVALTPALKRVSQSDPVQCFYLQYNLPDIFMTFVFWMKDFFQKYSAVNYYYCSGCYCYGSTVIFLMAYCFSMTVVSIPP